MEIFSRLFGANRPPEGPISQDHLMSEDAFWSIIESTYADADGDYDQQQDNLSIKLSELGLPELIAFDNRFRQLSGNAYRWNLWGAIYIIHGGCGDDSFSDFRGWLICQGKDMYYQVVENPETLVNINQERIETDWEGASYIAFTLYEKRTGKAMPTDYKENLDIIGEQWSEDGDDLQRLFPLLWKKYGHD